MGERNQYPIPQERPNNLRDHIRLELARPLVVLGSIPPNAGLTICAERKDNTNNDTTLEEVSFFKSPAPNIASGEAEWFLVRNGERHPNPVALFGACTPGARYLARGVVKAGVGFYYAETAFFRSSEDAPLGLLRKELPLPECLDPYILELCVQVGQVVEGIDEQLYWRMPVDFHETGSVWEARLSV